MGIEMERAKNTVKNLYGFVIIFLIGGGLRIYDFAKVPGGYQMDEAYSAWNAFNLFHVGMDSAGKSWPVYFEAWGHGMNALNSYLMLPFIALNQGHISLWVVRMPQLLISLCSMIAMYFLCKRFADRKTALLGMTMLAIAPWHIMVSRWGLESQLVMGLLLIAFCFFAYGTERPALLVLSFFCYGLALYCYATIWPVLPFILGLQLFYFLKTGKLKVSIWLWIGILILALMAFPLIAFLLVNMGYMQEFQIGFLSVYKMQKFRGGELARSPGEILLNLKRIISLLYRQDVSRPYDVIMPHGFFYQWGRAFVILGMIFSFGKAVSSVIQKRFSACVVLWIYLLGSFVLGAFVYAQSMTQINSLYLPLLLCETVGIGTVTDIFVRKEGKVQKYISIVIAVLICLLYTYGVIDFTGRYFTDYRAVTNAYFQADTDRAVLFARDAAKEHGKEVFVDAAIKYPSVALFTETDAEQFLATVVYNPDDMPAAKSFETEGVTFHMGYDPEKLRQDGVYVIYYTETEQFADYNLTPFNEWWYVAVPVS